MTSLSVIGGGLAGCEAAWQAAEHGLEVTLYEMRPLRTTGAHTTSQLSELVCSNSLGSSLPYRAAGLLKLEVALMGSMLLDCAQRVAVPAGTALAVDRAAFSELVTSRIQNHRHIRLVRQEITRIPPGLCIVASGPLTSDALAGALTALTGEANLAFFDAISPIIEVDSIDFDIAFRASRSRGGQAADADYINCSMGREEYYRFVAALATADRIPLRDIEAPIADGVRAGTYFEGCLPIEVMAGRGLEALAFGPLRPIGLRDPRTGKRPYAVVQLRQDNLAGTLYNLVGFQTNLRYPEQERVFRMIPGLQQAEFARFGQMHRNTYIASPRLLRPTLQFHDRDDLLFAGQIMGAEGYMGNIATGLLAGINAGRIARGEQPWVMPPETMIGALCHYVTHADLRDFQPMKANYGILPSLQSEVRGGKVDRARAYTERALSSLTRHLALAPA
ncbi:MAG TPA: methylenetetrahydrofolate--tRNA-(uracil(54)-C(5))-methyltransferase (FADH(2)-oxidizing) TrmFO [Anaerolineales bacterium]